MSNIELNYEHWMRYAMKLAQRAKEEGEVPIGAVLTYNSKLIGEGWNRSINCKDPTMHAEIMALRQGGLALQNYRLLGCTLYVTLEPCIMCYGAILNGRISRLVYGARDKKANTESLLDMIGYHKINYHTLVVGGVLAKECSEILSNFFRMRRLQQNNNK